MSPAIVIWKLLKIGDQQAFVGWPGAARDDALPAMDEGFDLWERLGLSGDGNDTVETGVATKGGVVEADAFQKFHRGAVLHKEMTHVAKLFPEPAAIPLEEVLVGLENQGDVIEGNALLTEHIHVVEPELVFDEESRDETAPFHPTSGVPQCVDGEI